MADLEQSVDISRSTHPPSSKGHVQSSSGELYVERLNYCVKRYSLTYFLLVSFLVSDFRKDPHR
jgi:hypothetical protein